MRGTRNEVLHEGRQAARRHRPTGSAHHAQGPDHAGGDLRVPHRHCEDQEAGGEKAGRPHLRHGEKGQRLPFEADPCGIPDGVRRLQGEVRNHRGLNLEGLPARGQADLGLHRQRAPLRALHSDHQRLDGPDGRGRLRAEDRDEALRLLKQALNFRHRARPNHEEPLQLLQAAQTREEQDQRTAARRAEPHARPCEERPPRTASNRDRTGAHNRHAPGRDMRPTLERPRRKRNDICAPRARQDTRRLLREGPEDLHQHPHHPPPLATPS